MDVMIAMRLCLYRQSCLFPIVGPDCRYVWEGFPTRRLGSIKE